MTIESDDLSILRDTTSKFLLAGRIKKLRSGRSWAEDPPSRTRHLFTNVRITKDDGRTLEVESNFHLYRTRLNSEETSWIGSRRDVLRCDCLKPCAAAVSECRNCRCRRRSIPCF